MQRNESDWQIMPQPLPAWVQDQEKVLSEMIKEELNSQTFSVY
jgi:hypothetical protein